jgi:hypothetical protein
VLSDSNTLEACEMFVERMQALQPDGTVEVKIYGDAAGRVSIDPRCLRLIRDLERVVWKADAHGNLGAQIDKSDPELTHVSDALGYLIEREFSLQASPRIRIR